jgi:hypothetical protein
MERKAKAALGRADAGISHWGATGSSPMANAAMKELLTKMVPPVVKRKAVAHLKAQLGLVERRACQIVGAERKVVRYQS